MRLFRPCFIAGWLYPEAIFRIRTDEKLLCLTFDDGPDPASTPELLELLNRFNIKGIFFCDGRAAEKYPELVELIKSRGHMTGNHGFLHPDGWRTPTKKYIQDVSRACGSPNSTLLRPPFGRMKPGQYRILKKKYKIVLWDIMPYDFDRNFSSEKSLNVLKKMMRPGSIIVLHDKPSSDANMIVAEFVPYAVNMGYRFEMIV
jgi:peptidoglycan/xylan/chitin deacetylase (PgdA/CDA1 family)